MSWLVKVVGLGLMTGELLGSLGARPTGTRAPPKTWNGVLCA